MREAEIMAMLRRSSTRNYESEERILLTNGEKQWEKGMKKKYKVLFKIFDNDIAKLILDYFATPYVMFKIYDGKHRNTSLSFLPMTPKNKENILKLSTFVNHKCERYWNGDTTSYNLFIGVFYSLAEVKSMIRNLKKLSIYACDCYANLEICRGTLTFDGDLKTMIEDGILPPNEKHYHGTEYEKYREIFCGILWGDNLMPLFEKY